MNHDFILALRRYMLICTEDYSSTYADREVFTTADMASARLPGQNSAIFVAVVRRDLPNPNRTQSGRPFI
jgi:hypothetical protein